MAPKAALILCLAGIAWLLTTDPDRKSRISPALWIPTIWVLIIGSRMVSQWLNYGNWANTPEFYIEGSPLDRNIFSCLILAGIFVLVKRKPDVARIISNNKWIFALLLFGGMSILWSDFPLVSFKRWMKSGVGNAVMTLIVLTDEVPVTATKVLLKRVSYVLIPASILLIKYFPDMGRRYSIWTWTPFYTGVSTSKNGLGYICLVCGLFFAWSLISLWRERSAGRNRMEIAKALFFLLAILWLLKMANSATSLAGMVLGTTALLITERLAKRNRMRLFSGILVGCFAFFLLFNQAFGIEKLMLSGLGRDESLTGRTELWDNAKRLQPNVLLGAGYDSFWLGNRAEALWKLYYWHPIQAHNGYLETYLDLGWIGLTLLVLATIAAYFKIQKNSPRESSYGRFRLAVLLVVLAYNVTEAAFNGIHLMWFIFLLVAVQGIRAEDGQENAAFVKPESNRSRLSPTWQANPLN